MKDGYIKPFDIVERANLNIDDILGARYNLLERHYDRVLIVYIERVKKYICVGVIFIAQILWRIDTIKSKVKDIFRIGG